jgi:peptide/nickel transport system substrate-binding protein
VFKTYLCKQETGLFSPAAYPGLLLKSPVSQQFPKEERNPMLRKILLLTLLPALVIALVVACGPQEAGAPDVVEVTRIIEGEAETIEVEVTRVVEVPADTTTGPSGELIVSLATMPNSIYFPNAAERNARNVANQLFDSLTWIDDESNIVPALAESWEISEEGTEYIFTLRQGVVFHDGTTMTARDVVATWEAGKDPENAYFYFYEDALLVEEVDEYTVRMVTEEPNPLFLRRLAEWGVIPADYYAEVGRDGLEQAPIGTGPFKLVEMVPGDRIVLEAHTEYWDEGLPYLARVVFRPITESSTRVAAVQTGELHIANRLNAEEAQSIMGVQGVTIIRYPVDRVFYIAFNNLTSGVGLPTEDPLVRQAMNYAVDTQLIIDALFNGFADQITGFITSGNLGYNDSLEPYPYDPDRARDLLAEAGYPDGFTIGMACPSDAYINFEQVCQAVGGFLAEVGIVPEGGDIEFMESGRYWDLEANKELPPLFGDSWSTTDGEALNRLTGALGGWDASYSAWAEPVIDDYLAQISTTVDPDARAALYSELQVYMYENPPFIYLYQPNTFEAISTRVQNYRPRAAEDYFLKDVFIATPGD